MQSVPARIWTCVTVSISYDDNHYTTVNSNFFFYLPFLFVYKTQFFPNFSVYILSTKTKYQQLSLHSHIQVGLSFMAYKPLLVI